MKKILPLLLLIPMALTVDAKTVALCEMQSNFPEALASGLSIPEGWTSFGVNAVPTGSLSNLFTSYTPETAFSIFEKNGIIGAFTPSEFEGGIKNDQWLISPEFTVTEDLMLITYTVSTYGNSINNNYSIYISESGEDIKEFYEIIGSSIKGTGDKMSSSTRRFVLDGYLGEKVRLAFISKDNTSGMMGFSDISVAPYYIAINNANILKNIILDPLHEDISFDVTLATPTRAKGLKAILTTSSGYETTFYYSHLISAATETDISINFPKLEMNGENSCQYRISIIPDYNDAPATELTGTINYANREYPGVAVMEELTGTWCGFCVYGFGVMNYLQDNYCRADDGLALGFAVHSGSGSIVDPMQVKEVLTPTTALANKLKYPGFPYMIINRKRGTHPLYAIDICKDIIAEKSYAKVEISKVDFDPSNLAVKVNYNSYLTFSADNPPINALVYITQNNMSGTGRFWQQKNYLNTSTKEDIIDELGKDLVPYFESYINRKEDLLTMEFPDVSRAILPSFEGERLSGEWNADFAKEGSFEFIMPYTITDWENSAISVILTNASTGEIIAGDRAEASYYNKDLMAVNTVGDNTMISVCPCADGNIRIIAPTHGYAEIYSIDGRKIKTCMLQEGSNLINAGGYSGMYVVKVSTGNLTQSTKLIL